MESKTQNLWQILLIVNDWIKHSDAKAVALLGIQGIILSFVLSQCLQKSFFELNNRLTFVIFIVALFLNIISIFLSFICLNPRLKLHGGISPMYFGSIAKNFQNSEQFQKFFNKKLSSHDNVEFELCGQVYVNSCIAWNKFRFVSYS